MWFFYSFLAICGILSFRFFFPHLYFEVLLPLVHWSLWWTLKVCKRVVIWVIQKLIILWNSPDKILLFPVKIFIGIVALVTAVIKLIPKIPSGIKKILTVIWRPDSDGKEHKKDVLEEMLNYIEGCGLGPPFSKIKIQHLFYIAYYRHYNCIAPDTVIDNVLGAYINRRDTDELPIWVKSFISEYEDDLSLETLELPRWPKIRRYLVSHWRAKNPKEIVSVADFEALPWWMKTLTRGHCIEKVDTIRLIKDCFNESVPKKERENTQT